MQGKDIIFTFSSMKYFLPFTVGHLKCKLFCLVILSLCLQLTNIKAADSTPLVSEKKTDGWFCLAAVGRTAPLCLSSHDFAGVLKVAEILQADIEKVTTVKPDLYIDTYPKAGEIMIIGTLGSSRIIDSLASENKIDGSQLAGKWEKFLIQVVRKPLPGVDHALVIAGSDKRGTLYGMFELSAQIGVSPWYWWADVPVASNRDLYIAPGPFTLGEPSVKYRGIFLNDEAPDLTNWVAAKFGWIEPRNDPPVPQGVANYNSAFYEKIFELILRLRGNYLWPAMWNNAFNEDDPENPRLADEYGIVMGTSHQEPMLRAQKEWDRRFKQRLGSWNYAGYPDTLENFWREGIRRNRNYESIITIGLRGADDTEMAPGGPEANMTLLERIVAVQRNIIAEEMNPDVEKVPQMWCLYKEVQEYHSAGMRIPEDVTLLWAEDNWGNLRRVPTAEERKRSGGAGIYYHFDYHGGPRSYQWINTSPVSKIWDQLTFARQYGADRIWIVNVGHFKGYEFPLHYFMDLAWYSDSLRHDNIREYTRLWAAQQFGPEFAREIAEIISNYTRFNGRRKPELLDPSTYSLIHYREAETVVNDYNNIAVQAESIYYKLPVDQRDAFYQLVLFPAKACAMVNDLYVTAGKNQLYAKQLRASTNDMADHVLALFQADTSLMGYYNRSFAGGKWSHFMDQAHLGYTGWRDPPVNSLQAIELRRIVVPENPAMGVSPEGTEDVWPGNPEVAILPEFDVFNRQSRYLEIFNRGTTPFRFEISKSAPWMIISEAGGLVEKNKRIWISIDWESVPAGKNHGALKVSGTGQEVDVVVTAVKPLQFTSGTWVGFVEGNCCVSIEAEHYTHKTDIGGNRWIRVEDYGHTLSAMRATAEIDAPVLTPGKDSPFLEYQMYLFNGGKVIVEPIFAPTLNFLPGRGIRYGISFDNEEPQVVTLVPEDYDARNGNADWEKSVSDNSRRGSSIHMLSEPGYYTLKIWMVDPGVILQKIVVDTGGVKPSYLGPPESYRDSDR